MAERATASPPNFPFPHQTMAGTPGQVVCGLCNQLRSTGCDSKRCPLRHGLPG
jgi:hypothetical protein